MRGWSALALAFAVLIGAVVVYYAVIFRGQLPDHRWIVGYNDLVLHAAAFLALSLPLLLLWPPRRVLPGLAALAAALEGIQFWLPRRTPGWDDLAASMAGALIGAGVVGLARWMGGRSRMQGGRLSMSNSESVISVIGLGYVGLPLAVEFGRHRPVIGFDIKPGRIAELRAGRDHTREVSPKELAGAGHLALTDDPEALRAATIHIVTVPTPIDAHKRPDLTPLLRASETLGRVLKRGDIVIYESTVYPGATEEDCVPVLERVSGLKFNVDFFAGYSPERINPGDKAHRLTTIRKVTSGSTPEVAEKVDALYASIVTAGTYRAESIRVAEAAKVIENTQRDLNIALVNELAIIFNRMGIDTEAVLRAAGTKWNFLPFRPGLVGGHCIGVDPYYLTHKAEALGYHPQVILAGRRINDGMGAYVAGQLVKAMLKRRIQVDGARVLVLGLTFKENCPDLRNTRVVDVIAELRDYGVRVDVHDPWADPAEARAEYGLELTDEPEVGAYDGVLLAVAHEDYRQAGTAALRGHGVPGHVFFDLKSVFPRGESELRL